MRRFAILLLTLATLGWVANGCSSSHPTVVPKPFVASGATIHPSPPTDVPNGHAEAVAVRELLLPDATLGHNVRMAYLAIESHCDDLGLSPVVMVERDANRSDTSLYGRCQ